MPLTQTMQNGYIYADIEKWPESERWELIDGIAYNMTPPPARIHQTVLGILFRKIGNYLEGKQCAVYVAPFGVWFLENNADISNAKNYVEPDISIICDKNKLTDKGCVGSPDMIIEILSPSTAAKDLIKKLSLYENSGVREYWVVHPTDFTVMVFELVDGRYGKPKTYSPDEEGLSEVKVGIFENLVIDLKEIFIG
ncbi:Uma2 family endonuclease [Sporomusa termitida]|uniref:Restriction endonuclease n=1 Tax=Sporomusa termitida TaxID=2377 RepID=A0A517DXF0_9FIRM|nr:Uma2 family endonuclease [Sporomusa termitida]QDR82003.1 Putative restriction endonuclease [Sporomusa termitida]